MVEARSSAVDVTFDAAVGTRRRVARLLPLDVPPLPGWCERSGPHADAVLLRLLLGGNVVGSVLPIGQCPALTDHPAVQVLTTGMADRNDTAIPIFVLDLAGNRAAADEVRQRKRRLLPTTVVRSAEHTSEL